jgi:hypothetical protein
MIIVRVNWRDWNVVGHRTDVTSDMCPALNNCRTTEDKFSLAIKYIKRRYPEWLTIDSVVSIAE